LSRTDNVKNIPAKVGKADRGAMAQALKWIYKAGTLKEPHEAFEAFERAWGLKIVAGWMKKSYALLEFLNHPKTVHPYRHTTNHLGRVIKGQAEGGGDPLWARSRGKAFLSPRFGGKEPLRVSKTAHRIRANTVLQGPCRRHTKRHTTQFSAAEFDPQIIRVQMHFQRELS